MDPFRRMMEMEGVTPLNARETKPVARNDNTPKIEPQNSIVKTTGVSDYAWVMGQNARNTLETALARMTRERKSGQESWMIGIKQDGNSGNLSTFTASAPLLSYADRMNLKIIVIGGKGWTCVFHPQMGAATLDNDPE